MIIVRNLFGQKRRSPFSNNSQRGQTMALFVFGFMALLAFVGFATDAASLYVTYTQLKRAVDSAAIAAANNIKKYDTYIIFKENITESAREMIDIHNITNISLLEVYTCADADLPADFITICPEVGESPRKLAWVQATQEAPVYFLRLFGINDVPLTLGSVGEAATVDLVIVIDSSESMAATTPGYGYNFNPDVTCNGTKTCEPLETAKDAAKVLVDNMFEGYDRIAVVSFDFDSKVEIHLTGSPFDGVGSVKAAIESIMVHNDAPVPMDPVTLNPVGVGTFNPFNIDIINPGSPPSPNGEKAVLSTCTGCGIREAGGLLETYGRRDSVWVIVFLSDGATNVSDIPPLVDGVFPNGFCGGDIGERMWTAPMCKDPDPNTRNCGPYHANAAQCPPGSTWVGNESPPYDVEDYARDMIDQIALTQSTNIFEPIRGNQMSIYSIALGYAAWPPAYAGEEMLRYMANIGDDGSRLNDPCFGIAHQTQCGNYYYAPNATYLAQIFEDIADNIYTRLSR
jgi:hypothetical protein